MTLSMRSQPRGFVWMTGGATKRAGRGQSLGRALFGKAHLAAIWKSAENVRDLGMWPRSATWKGSFRKKIEGKIEGKQMY